VKSSSVVGQITKKEAIVMTEREFEGIQRQLASLRRENRFLKVGLIFCLVLSVMPYLTGFQPEFIYAKRVITEAIEFVRDEKTVASITVHHTGNGLVISDKYTKPLVRVSNNGMGGQIDVYNIERESVATIAAVWTGSWITISNNKRKTVVQIGAFPNGGLVNIFNNDAKLGVGIGAYPTGGLINIFNNNEQIGATIGALPYGGSVSIYDNNEKMGAFMGVTPQGNRIIVYNKDGKPVAEMVGISLGGRLALLDEKGKIVWAAP
jgi:hypothetical protein